MSKQVRQRTQPSRVRFAESVSVSSLGGTSVSNMHFQYMICIYYMIKFVPT